jgi:hypothetical protein
MDIHIGDHFKPRPTCDKAEPLQTAGLVMANNIVDIETGRSIRPGYLEWLASQAPAPPPEPASPAHSPETSPEPPPKALAAAPDQLAMLETISARLTRIEQRLAGLASVLVRALGDGDD